jgi:hypothetical protein
MRHLRWMALALVFFSGAVEAAELRVIHVFDTGPFLCASGWKDLWWENTRSDMRVKATTIWMGMDIGGKADYTATLYGYSRVTGALDLIQFVGWDHYTDPSAPSGFSQSFGADWITVPSGGWLRLLTSCNGFAVGIHGHVGVFLQYVTP